MNDAGNTVTLLVAEDYQPRARQILEVALGATGVNLSCDRNWAYRERDPDPPFWEGRPNPHVHWHVVPRHRTPVKFRGLR